MTGLGVPQPTGPITSAGRTTADSAAAQFELHVLGAVTAVGHVLRARGAGTVLLTTGVSSTVVPGGGEADPDAVGARYYRLHQNPDQAEEVIGEVDALRATVAAWSRTPAR